MPAQPSVSAPTPGRMRHSAMAEGDDQSEAIGRLSAALVEMRAELLVTQAALAVLMAEMARSGKDPEALLGDSVVRLLGFAESAALGLAGQPGVLMTAPTAAALRIADWAEGIFTQN